MLSALGLDVVPAVAAAGSSKEFAEHTVAHGETSWRWIGLRDELSLSCPPPPAGWILTTLDNSSSASPLSQFCFYEIDRSSKSAPFPPVASIKNISGSFLRLEQDRMVLNGAAGALEESVWPILQDQFLAQVGAVSLPFVPPNRRVRLAIIDSAPTSSNGAVLAAVGNGSHGMTLLHMANRLLCEEPGWCAVHLTTRLALAYTGFGSSERSDAGGYIGTVGELAEAILAEVKDWESSAREEPGLVINLSLGWDPIHGGMESEVEDMPVAVQAAYRVLEHAACSGALVVAAAGNRDGGPVPGSGAILPAAWEGRPAPPSCDPPRGGGGGPVAEFPRFDKAWFGPDEPTISGYKPLVYAAGGLQANSRPLPISRALSAPPLAAYGDHAVVALNGEAPTSTLTGTSVSTLVISSVAAAVWSYRNDLQAEGVMELLYHTAESLGEPIDVCMRIGSQCAGERTDIHRVRLCEAVVEACGSSSSMCFAGDLDCKIPPVPLSNLIPLAQAAVTDDYDLGAWVQSATYPQCHPEVTYFYNDPPSDPLCPHLMFEGMQTNPWIYPQPGSDPCPSCPLDTSGGTLYMQINGAMSGLSQPMFTTCGISYSLDPSVLNPNQVVAVQTPGVGSCGTAQISFSQQAPGGSMISVISTPLLIP